LYQAGTPVAGITVDLFGNARDESNPSIGCFEGPFVDLPAITAVLNTDTLLGVTGRWHPAQAARYENLQTFGVDGTSETGTYTGASSDPTTPTISASDDGNSDSITVTISGADAGTETTIFYREFNSLTWIEWGTKISHNGSATITGLSEWRYYEFYAYSSDSGLHSLPVFTDELVQVTDGGEQENIQQYRVTARETNQGSDKVKWTLQKVDKPLR